MKSDRCKLGIKCKGIVSLPKKKNKKDRKKKRKYGVYNKGNEEGSAFIYKLSLLIV